MLEAIFLYIILHDDNSNGERFRVKMPSMEVCLQSLDKAKATNPKKIGGDYEVMSVMFCGTGHFDKHHGITWHESDIK